MSEADFEETDNQPADTRATGPNASAEARPAEETVEFIPREDAATLAEQLGAANDRVLRAQAELENFRKRTRRELEDQRRYANFALLGDLLPVLDNLHRAVEAAEQTDATSGLLEGVKMVSAQMLGVLDQHGCRPIEALGTTFDPNLHEAIGKEPSTELVEGTVTRVTRTGYQLHDRVVRPPQVLISGGPPTHDPADPSEA